MPKYTDVQLKCPKCKESFITTAENGTVDEDRLICEECGIERVIIKFSDITDPDVLLNWAASELENANWHDVIGLPGDIYGAVSPYIQEGNKAIVARVIAKAIVDQI